MDKGNDHEAIQYYNKAIELYNQAHTTNHQQLIAAAYHGIATIYQKQKNYSEALVYYALSLTLQEQYLPSEHLDIANSCNSIGVVHETLRKWKQALKYYQEASSICRHSLSPQHPDVIELERNIQRVSLY